MEELQEADVLWPDNHRADDHGCRGHGHQPQRRETRLPHHQVDVAGQPRHGSSAPVGIPEIRSPTTEQASCARRNYIVDDGDGSASASFVAPHEMAARRRCAEADQVERSVCVGHGRTLKGRDLRSVRTAVLRMTGFLET